MEPFDVGLPDGRIVEPEGAHDRGTAATNEEVLEQIEGGGVGPVQVLDEQAERPLAAQRVEGGRDRGEQALSRPAGSRV